MHIELQFSLTAEDIQAFHRDSPKALRAMKTKGIFHSRRVILAGLVLVTAIMLLVMFHNDPNEVSTAPTTQPKNSAVVEFFITLLPYLLIFIFVWYFIFRRKARAKRAFQNSPHLGEERKVVITDESVSIQMATATSGEKWSHFIYFQEGSAVFSLWGSRQIANVIPKRAFKSEEQMHEFSAFAKAHVRNQTRSLSPGARS